MKKYKAFMLLGVLCYLFLSVYPDPSVNAEEFMLTPDQIEHIQLDVDILGECVFETSFQYVRYGFSSEFAVLSGFGECEQEGANVLTALKEAGVSESNAPVVVNGLFELAVSMVDISRNEAAMKRLNEDASKIIPQGTSI